MSSAGRRLYEWKKLDPKTKQPYAYILNNGEPFAFGGLWDAWRSPETGKWLQTFAIITTGPNALTAEVHNRMPLILHPRDYDRWLERGDQVQLPVDLLRPYDADDMSAAVCNPKVGNVRINRRCSSNTSAYSRIVCYGGASSKGNPFRRSL